MGEKRVIDTPGSSRAKIVIIVLDLLRLVMSPNLTQRSRQFNLAWNELFKTINTTRVAKISSSKSSDLSTSFTRRDSDVYLDNSRLSRLITHVSSRPVVTEVHEVLSSVFFFERQHAT